MKVTKTKLPDDSILSSPGKEYDYVDSYLGTLNDHDNTLSLSDVGKAFFSSSPKWIDKLFAIRNNIVAIFGLKTSGKISNREEQLKNFKC